VAGQSVLSAWLESRWNDRWNNYTHL